ncbi:putative fad binding domain-containing protein [Paramyrothecium foliicola]|nr:putative fad binding domain-containing protein [Paramyrothecium foliicola]
MRITIAAASAQTSKAAIATLLDDPSEPEVVGIYRDLKKVPSEFQKHPKFLASYGDLHDSTSLDFSGSDAVLVLTPPKLDGSDYVEHAKRIASNVRNALAEAPSVRRLVYVSSVGAQHPKGVGEVRTNNASETIYRNTTPEVIFVRNTYFMENWASAVATIQSSAPHFYSPITPADYKLPMVSVRDIGKACAAQLLDHDFGGPSPKIVDLHGPVDCSPRDVQKAFEEVTGKSIELRLVEKDQLHGFFAQVLPSTIVDDFVEMHLALLPGGLVEEDMKRTHNTCFGQDTLVDAFRRMFYYVAAASAAISPNYTSPAGVEIYNPQFFTPTGPWSLMSRVENRLYIAGMRGISPTNNTLVPVGIDRIRQAYTNMIDLAEMAGTDRYSAARLVVYTTDMYRWRPLCNQVQLELWGNDPNRHPPRSIIEVQRLNDDDIVEVEVRPLYRLIQSLNMLLCSFTFLSALALSSVNGQVLATCACSKLSKLLPDSVLPPDSANYTAETKKFWDRRSAVSPACIVFPSKADDVAKVLPVLNACEAQFAIRGGGHMNFPGSNNIEGGVLLALNKLSHAAPSPKANTIAVGPGARWVDVYNALDPHGQYTIGGRLKSIGVPGLTLIGGFHYLINKYGFTMDNIVRYEVVLGNGTQVVADAKTHADLFWALKGGANNFGIVTNFVLKTYNIPKISTTIQQFNETFLKDFVRAASEHTMSDDGTVGAGSVLNIQYNLTTRGTTSQLLGVQEGTESPPSRFKHFSAIPSISTRNAVTTPKQWHSAFDTPDQMFRVQFAHHTIRAEAADRLIEIVEAWKVAVDEIRDVEGLVPTFVLNTIARSAMTVARENGIGNTWGLSDDEPLIIWQLSTGWANASDDLRMTSWAKNFLEYHHSVNQERGLAHEFIYMGDAGEYQNPFVTFPSENVQRLRDVRRRYDTGLVFSKLNWGGFKLLMRYIQTFLIGAWDTNHDLLNADCKFFSTKGYASPISIPNTTSEVLTPSDHTTSSEAITTPKTTANSSTISKGSDAANTQSSSPVTSSDSGASPSLGQSMSTSIDPTPITQPLPTFISPSSTVSGTAETSAAASIGPLLVYLWRNRDWIEVERHRDEYINSVEDTHDSILALFNNLPNKPMPNAQCFQTSLTKRSLISSIIDELKSVADLISCAVQVVDNLVKAVKEPVPPISIVTILTDTLNDINTELEKKNDSQQSQSNSSPSQTQTASETSSCEKSAVPSCTETITLSTSLFADSTTTTSRVRTITTTSCTTITACSATATTTTITVSTTSSSTEPPICEFTCGSDGCGTAGGSQPEPTGLALERRIVVLQKRSLEDKDAIADRGEYVATTARP